MDAKLAKELGVGTLPMHDEKHAAPRVVGDVVGILGLDGSGRIEHVYPLVNKNFGFLYDISIGDRVVTAFGMDVYSPGTEREQSLFNKYRLELFP